MGKKYDELQIGQKFESLPVTITETHIVIFGGLIGNWHPSHLNDEFSSRTQFKKRVCHGELTVSLMLTGFADILSDTSNGHLGGAYRLLSPVYAGDTIYTEMEIISRRKSKSRSGGIIKFGLKTYNQKGMLVAQGTADFLVSNEKSNLYSSSTPAGQASSVKINKDGEK